MEKVKSLDSPFGWLLDPNNKWAIHFDFKKAPENNTGAEFTIDMWGVSPEGNPMKFKSRRKATKIDSLKTWNQLISSNWKKVDFDKIKSA